MKVHELYTRPAKACRAEENLGEVVRLMWENDLGAAPVVDQSGKVVGMLTDRDICIAVATRRVPAGEIRADQVMSTPIQACSPEDDVRDALNTMWTRKVRRLPVVNSEGRLLGILTLADIARHAGGNTGLTYEDVVVSLNAISAPRKVVAAPKVKPGLATAKA